MRVLVTGDKHLGLTSDGEPRLGEQRRVLDRCAELLRDLNPDAYVDLGDLFHSPRPGPDAYEVAFDYLREIGKWCANSGRPAFLLAGNHDKQTRGGVSALAPLEALRRSFPQLPEPVLRPKTAGVGPVVFVLLPFVTEWEARQAGHASAQAWMDDGAARVSEKTGGRRLLVFCHMEVPGATAHAWDATQRDVGLRLPAALLENPLTVRAYAGHVHRHQELERVTVVGSAVHVDFGEAPDEKGAVLAEVL